MIVHKGITGAVCLLVALAPASLVCAAEEQPTAGPPSIAAVKVVEPPVIDGVLNDSCWQQATHVEGFWREDLDAPELERTEAWICHDSRAIYVAFRCHDSKPSQICSDQKKRQGSLWRDDSVEFWLDVENTGQHFYSFRVNPAGTQYDGVPGGTSEKIEWKGDWHAGALIDEGGWSAEMEVPFAILRYSQGQQTFRFNFGRRLARPDHRVLWPACLARVFDMDNCARWTGIEAPPVPFRYVLMPYLLSVAAEDEQDRENLTGGVDFKGTLPNGVVTLATYNPDFRNIEDVVETIDFTFVERYLPEYRPFFREGAGYFPSSRIFYSRRIEELDWGAKTFGTVGAHRFAVLDAYRRGGENHLAWEYDHLFGNEGSIQLSGVHRRVPGDPHNAAYDLGADWNWRFPGGSRNLYAHRYQSCTQGEGGDDGAVYAGTGLSRNQGLDWSFNYESVDPEFRADDGYVPETGVRRFAVDLYDHHSYDEGATQAREWWFSADTGESESGRRQGFWLGNDYYWRSGWSMWTGTSHGERDGFDVVDYYIGGRWNRKDMYHTGKVDYIWGHRYDQPYRYQRLIQAFHPSQRWSAELRAERLYAADLDDEWNVVPPEWSRQLVFTTTCDISEERTASARLVRRGSHTNPYAAYRQRVRRGMDLLIVVGDPNADEWVSRVAVKAIWCL